MDIRQFIFVYIISIITQVLLKMQLCLCNSVVPVQEDPLVENMHNYTNLNIFLWSGSGDSEDETTTIAKSPTTAYIEDPEDCIGGQDCNIRLTTAFPPITDVIDVPQTTNIPDQIYWIVTEFQTKTPVNLTSNIIEDRLSALYALAFIRQQAKHLGLNSVTNRTNSGDNDSNFYRDRRWNVQDNRIRVEVRILPVSKEFDLVYYVKVNGRPITATVAVHDMSLVTAREVTDHLGYAIKIKARPYLGESLALKVQGIAYGQIFLYASLVFLIVLALIIAVLINHHKKNKQKSTRSNRGRMAFNVDQTPHKNVKTEGTSTEDIIKVHTPEPLPRSKNKITDSLLSMQAANKFQKDSLPGPLTQVLEKCEDKKNFQKVSRHESIEGQDPGVVGPIVWDLHCKKMDVTKIANNLDNVSLSSFETLNATENNVTKMRQRFHDLLDDAFTLFGSRNSSLQSNDSSHSSSINDLRSKSAPFRSSTTSRDLEEDRPKTSVNPDDLTPEARCWAPPPLGEAWIGSDQSIFAPRPLSAGPFHRPTLNTEFITTDADLSPQDPAVPLIKAIRKELNKFPSNNFVD
ncbi:uncharacterized protein LOC126894356 isoform X3 [Daktulosphaira vitifoliae]|uniref:uncharacterized protein LOC126894356 isoform X3 n=1 Tax=Daktulosphaira vitifoliae TaxID=58002 RepID=UPI0021AA8E9F|nr:uncharacterized protein LOC126894356 isoform X3 [Daktulosphaira vitifoliae]